MQEMKAVSDIWLNGRKEKGFSLGFFDEAYLQQAPIAIVESEEGEIVAFANIMPTKNKRVATIDLMRYDFEKAPEG
ncbi:phosphatidylglycerol lysyltransferase domain-containing protein, partial [Brucella melitensis]